MAARAPRLTLGVCKERQRLDAEFVQAVREVMALHESEIKTLVRDEEAPCFEIALRVAQLKREEAKHQLLRHITEHGC